MIRVMVEKVNSEGNAYVYILFLKRNAQIILNVIVYLKQVAVRSLFVCLFIGFFFSLQIPVNEGLSSRCRLSEAECAQYPEYC